MIAAVHNLAHKTLERRSQELVRAISRMEQRVRELNVELDEAKEEHADLELEARQIAAILEGGAA